MKQFFLLLIIPIALFSQTPETLGFDITFPQHSDTVDTDKIRISGHTDPAASVTINDRPVRLFPHGSFVTRVPLEEGMNRIIIVAKKGTEIVRDILFIYREPVPISLPPKPTAIDPLIVEPQRDIWLRQGEFLRVKFKASPGGRATFRVDKVGKNFPMIELPAEEADGLLGVYAGTIRLIDAPENIPLGITFEIEGIDGKKKRQKAPGEVSLLPGNMPLIGRTKTKTFLHAAADRYVPIGRIPKDIDLHIIGRQNERYKVDLLERTAFVDIKDMALQPWGTPLPHATIMAPQIDWTSDWLHLRMTIDKAVPFFVDQKENPLRLTLRVFGAQQGSHWITYPNGASELQKLKLSQADENIFSLSLELAQSHSWGYRCFYQDGILHLFVRRRPKMDPANPLAKMIIAVDPGHGGDETGAISPLGVYEKDINLLWAKALAEKLRQKGAMAVLTRVGDETVSLQERIDRAERAGAILFISLHNNGVGPNGNALAATGTSTFFSLEHNKALSWAIYPHMVKLGLAPYGKIYNSYFVTNATSFLTTLVEGGFLTHPEEELKLADPQFIDQMADAVMNGIKDFLQSRIEQQP